MADKKWSSEYFNFTQDGWLWGDSDIPGGSIGELLTPNEALNLASALLQYATQNGATREQAD